MAIANWHKFCFLISSFIILPFQIERILLIDTAALANVCEVLQIPQLSTENYEFLREYQKVLKCVVTALKMVESNTYTFGSFLPILFGLRSKFAKLKGNTKHAAPLVEKLSESLEDRFGASMNFFSPEGAAPYIAMISNPKFKLSYLGMKTIPSHTMLRAQQLLIDACTDVCTGDLGESNTFSTCCDDGQTDDQKDDDEDEGNLFIYNDVSVEQAQEEQTPEAKKRKMIKEEVDKFLKLKTTDDLYSGLGNFPIIRSVFIKYNCIRSSEADCERIFSYAG